MHSIRYIYLFFQWSLICGAHIILTSSKQEITVVQTVSTGLLKNVIKLNCGAEITTYLFTFWYIYFSFVQCIEIQYRQSRWFGTARWNETNKRFGFSLNISGYLWQKMIYSNSTFIKIKFTIFVIINVINNQVIGLIITSKKNNQTFRKSITAILLLLSKVLQILMIEVKCKGLHIFYALKNTTKIKSRIF